MIPLHKCQHGVLYRLRSRNLAIGIYDKDTGSFIGIRQKFQEKFLDREFHRELQRGTAVPLDALEESPFVELSTRDPEIFDWLELAPGRHR